MENVSQRLCFQTLVWNVAHMETLKTHLCFVLSAC